VQPTRKPLQFSMRTLLMVVTIVAVMAAILSYTAVTMTLLLMGLIALLFVGPVCLGTLALYTRGHRQTFFLGALAGSLSSFYLSTILMQYSGSLSGLFALCIVTVAATAACGLAALFTRRLLERRGWHRPSNHDDSAPAA
jgi:hypothetical protein